MELLQEQGRFSQIPLTQPSSALLHQRCSVVAVFIRFWATRHLQLLLAAQVQSSPTCSELNINLESALGC
jgi:hypothetical protein